MLKYLHSAPDSISNNEIKVKISVPSKYVFHLVLNVRLNYNLIFTNKMFFRFLFEIDDELPDQIQNDAGIFSSFLFMLIFRMSH